jgi:hypothetical protein
MTQGLHCKGTHGSPRAPARLQFLAPSWSLITSSSFHLFISYTWGPMISHRATQTSLGQMGLRLAVTTQAPKASASAAWSLAARHTAIHKAHQRSPAQLIMLQRGPRA